MEKKAGGFTKGSAKLQGGGGVGAGVLRQAGRWCIEKDHAIVRPSTRKTAREPRPKEEKSLGLYKKAKRRMESATKNRLECKRHRNQKGG